MIGNNTTNLYPTSAPAAASLNAYDWSRLPGYYHAGHPVLIQTGTGDLAYDGVADPYPIALPPAVEASIRARLEVRP